MIVYLQLHVVNGIINVITKGGIIMEVWKDIKGYEGIYQVSNLGNLKSLTRIIYDKNGVNKTIKGKPLKASTTLYGYKTVVFRNGKNKENFRVHRLVAKAFIKNEKDKPYVNHLDGDKTNNKVTNLEWCTNSENMKHAFKTGLKRPSNPNKNGLTQGSKHHNSKLTECDVIFIRKNSRHSGGTMKNIELAEMFKVTKVTIGYVVNNKIWKHIS